MILTAEALDRFVEVVDPGGDLPVVAQPQTTDRCPTYLAVVAHDAFLATISQALGTSSDLALRHVGHSVRVARAAPAGAALRAEATVSGSQPVPGGRLLAATAHVVDDAGAVATIVTTLLVRGLAGGPGWGDVRLPRPVRPAGSPISIDVPTAAGDPDRYAAVSGDRNPIHLDEGAARAAGLDGRILHGSFVLARAVAAVRARHPGSTVVRRVDARFGAAARPGVGLRIATWPADGAIGFTVDAGGRRVIRTGNITLADPPEREEPS